MEAYNTSERSYLSRDVARANPSPRFHDIITFPSPKSAITPIADIYRPIYTTIPTTDQISSQFAAIEKPTAHVISFASPARPPSSLVDDVKRYQASIADLTAKYKDSLQRIYTLQVECERLRLEMSLCTCGRPFGSQVFTTSATTTKSSVGSYLHPDDIQHLVEEKEKPVSDANRKPATKTRSLSPVKKAERSIPPVRVVQIEDNHRAQSAREQGVTRSTANSRSKSVPKRSTESQVHPTGRMATSKIPPRGKVAAKTTENEQRKAAAPNTGAAANSSKPQAKTREPSNDKSTRPAKSFRVVDKLSLEILDRLLHEEQQRNSQLLQGAANETTDQSKRESAVGNDVEHVQGSTPKSNGVLTQELAADPVDMNPLTDAASSDGVSFSTYDKFLPRSPARLPPKAPVPAAARPVTAHTTTQTPSQHYVNGHSAQTAALPPPPPPPVSSTIATTTTAGFSSAQVKADPSFAEFWDMYNNVMGLRSQQAASSMSISSSTNTPAQQLHNSPSLLRSAADKRLVDEHSIDQLLDRISASLYTINEVSATLSYASNSTKQLL